MNKIAIFVEGLTEQLFIEKLLSEIAGAKNIHIEKRQARGGAKSKRTLISIEYANLDEARRYYAQIVDCSNDSKVASDIRDQYDSLIKEGYQAIIGIRDVYPAQYTDIPKLRRSMANYMKTKPITVSLILAVMEIEAWFIAEYTHFPKLHEMLTLQKIKDEVGIDPSMDNIEQFPHPADDLQKIYQIAGLYYQKKKSHIELTIGKLDYASMYLNHRTLFKDFADFGKLINEIETFLACD